MNAKVYFSAENSMPQIFSIPKPLIRYICINPKPSPSLLYKLYFSCKFFYPKIKIVGLHEINFFITDEKISLKPCKLSDWGKELIFPRNAIKEIDFEFCCVKTNFNFYFNESSSPKFLSLMLKKLWHIENCHFYIAFQTLSVQELKFIAAGSRGISLGKVNVVDSNDEILPFEEILKLCPNVKEFSFTNNESAFTPQTAEALVALTRTIKLERFKLKYLPEFFGPIGFSTFIIKNVKEDARVEIYFDENVQDEIKENFATIVYNKLNESSIDFKKMYFKID